MGKIINFLTCQALILKSSWLPAMVSNAPWMDTPISFSRPLSWSSPSSSSSRKPTLPPSDKLPQISPLPSTISGTDFSVSVVGSVSLSPPSTTSVPRLDIPEKFAMPPVSSSTLLTPSTESSSSDRNDAASPAAPWGPPRHRYYYNG